MVKPAFFASLTESGLVIVGVLIREITFFTGFLHSGHTTKATRSIGKFIQADHIQLQNGNGYDHCFVLNKGITKTPELVAVAEGDQSGIIMNVYTTEPAMQLYTGNFMKGDNQLRGSFTDDFRTAFCLETQHYPNSPNEPIFPSTILEPGILFESKTIYEFPLIGK